MGEAHADRGHSADLAVRVVAPVCFPDAASRLYGDMSLHARQVLTLWFHCPARVRLPVLGELLARFRPVPRGSCRPQGALVQVKPGRLYPNLGELLTHGLGAVAQDLAAARKLMHGHHVHNLIGHDEFSSKACDSDLNVLIQIRADRVDPHCVLRVYDVQESIAYRFSLKHTSECPNIVHQEFGLSALVHPERMQGPFVVWLLFPLEYRFSIRNDGCEGKDIPWVQTYVLHVEYRVIDLDHGQSEIRQFSRCVRGLSAVHGMQYLICDGQGRGSRRNLGAGRRVRS